MDVAEKLDGFILTVKRSRIYGQRKQNTLHPMENRGSCYTIILILVRHVPCGIHCCALMNFVEP
uniref:Uncharacterized protein n=1 Tax=Arundo donax TaxID=35708 RepID=A0A0A8Z3Y6_ARUDO